MLSQQDGLLLLLLPLPPSQEYAAAWSWRPEGPLEQQQLACRVRGLHQAISTTGSHCEVKKLSSVVTMISLHTKPVMGDKVPTMCLGTFSPHIHSTTHTNGKRM